MSQFNAIEQCNNLEEVETLLENVKKEFHIYLKYVGTEVLSTYLATKRELEFGSPYIHTTQISFLSFDLIKKGYRIFVHGNNTVEFKPYMNYSGCKEIRFSHNILKLLMAGYFDEDLGIFG